MWGTDVPFGSARVVRLVSAVLVELSLSSMFFYCLYGVTMKADRSLHCFIEVVQIVSFP